MLKTVGFPSTRTGDQTIVDGNLVIGTAGKGIDFSATPGTGTSELLSDYEEGTFTATLSGTITNPTTPVTTTAYYTKIGRQVTVNGGFFNVDTTGATGFTQITGCPFTAANAFHVGSAMCDGFIVTSPGSYISNSAVIQIQNASTFGSMPIAAGAGKYLVFSLTFNV